MSTYPRLEARISAQERQQVILNARIEELAEDVTANITQLSTKVEQLSDRVTQLSADMKGSFQQLAAYQIEAERQIDTRFTQVDAQFAQVNSRLDNVETLLVQILARLPEQPNKES